MTRKDVTLAGCAALGLMFGQSVLQAQTSPGQSSVQAPPPASGPAPAAAASPAIIRPGHSQHGTAFDEGPRQRAKLMPGYGSVHFPITAASPEAQRLFDQGVNLLYSFFYFEAERSFRTALMLDPDCAMAYWGLARCEGSGARNRTFLEAAQKRSAKITDRERRYIAAEVIRNGPDKINGMTRDAAYVNALEQLVQRPAEYSGS